MDDDLSDESTMDPDIVVPDISIFTYRDWNNLFFTFAWKGLPLSLGLGVFMVTSSALHFWSGPVCTFGLFAAAVLAAFRDGSFKGPKTYLGVWMMVLHHASSLAILAIGLHDPLKQMGLGHLLSWLSKTDSISKSLLPVLILTVITTLFGFGLDRSTLLRGALLRVIAVFIAHLFIANCYWMFETNDLKAFEIENSTLVSTELSELFESTAFFSMAFSGTMDGISFPLTIHSFTSTFAMTLACMTGVMFLVGFVGSKLILAEPRISYFNAIANSFPYLIRMEIRKHWIFRDYLAVVSVVCLSLSLVEVFSVCLQVVQLFANSFLPLRLSARLPWTGTRLFAVIFTGLMSTVLAFSSSLDEMLFVCATSLLTSYFWDVMSMMFTRYRGVYTPPVPTDREEEERREYHVLEPIEEENSDDEVVSNDSGHSTDVDIDAMVHEYRDAVEIARPITEPPQFRGLSLFASFMIKAVLCLLVCMSCSFGMAIRLSGRGKYAALFLLCIFLCITVLWDYTSETTRKSVPSPWQPCLSISITVVLCVQLLVYYCGFIFFWHFMGVVLIIAGNFEDIDKLKAVLLRGYTTIKTKLGERVTRNVHHRRSANQLNQRDAV